MIIKNLRIYDGIQHQAHLQHLIIDNYGQITYLTDNELRSLLLTAQNSDNEIIYDAKDQYAAMPGMLDAHVHGQGGFDFGDAVIPENVMGAAEALGKTGLAYVMATVPTLNPGWCELRVLSELPLIVKGASVESGNRNQALYRILPGPAKATYALVRDKFYYIDKLAETMVEININSTQLDMLKQKLGLDTLLPEAVRNIEDVDQDNIAVKDINHNVITYQAFSRPQAPFDRLSLSQLKIIEEITQHKHVIGALPAVLQEINAYILKEKDNPTPGATNLVGVHLEGPFIAHNCKGAHDERALQNEISYNMLMDIISSGPDIKQWKLTLAPNLTGAIQFLEDLNHYQKELVEKGISIKVNIGHSNASKKQISEAVERGVVGFTHLGNACKESCCRKTRAELTHEMTEKDATSNVVQWVLDPENKNKVPQGVELITDTFHLSPDFIKLVLSSIGANKVMVVTDALGASGLSDDRYMLGTLHIIKKGDVFYLADDPHSKSQYSPYTTHPPTLAGGASSFAVCVKNYTQIALAEKSFACKMDMIFQSSVVNPRQTSLDKMAIHHLPDNKNMVIVDQEGEMVLSICNGKIMINEMAKLEKQKQQKLGNGLWNNSPNHYSTTNLEHKCFFVK